MEVGHGESPEGGRLASLIEEFRELWAAPGTGFPQLRAHLYLVQLLSQASPSCYRLSQRKECSQTGRYQAAGQGGTEEGKLADQAV